MILQILQEDKLETIYRDMVLASRTRSWKSDSPDREPVTEHLIKEAGGKWSDARQAKP